MHKKNYENVASAIKKHINANYQFRRTSVAGVARAIADEFKNDNAAFDAKKFFVACGLDEEGHDRRFL